MHNFHALENTYLVMGSRLSGNEDPSTTCRWKKER